MQKVLVLDDEPSYCTQLHTALSRQGYDVQTANTPEDALGIAESFTPQVLVADWMLKSQINGIQVARKLLDLNPGLVIILMTGFPSTELLNDSRNVGAKGILEKPFLLAELLHMLRQVC